MGRRVQPKFASLSVAKDTFRRLIESIIPDGSNPDAGTKYDDKFFTQLGGGSAVDLSSSQFVNAQKLSLYSYRKNVRAYHIIELMKDFVLGDGVKYNAVDPTVKNILDHHWAANEWETRAPEKLRSLSIFGEQCYPVFVNPESGLVRISSIKPVFIQSVNPLPGDPDTMDTVSVLIGTETAGSATSGPGCITDSRSVRYKIIRWNESLDRLAGVTKEEREVIDSWKGTIPKGIDNPLIGECFYFAVNKIAGATRGLPDLLASIDWLEGLDSFLFSLLERAEISQDVVYDLLVEGGQQEELKRITDNFAGSLQSGGVYAHNEKITLKIQNPELGASDAEIVSKMLLKNIHAGSGLAGLFFGDSEDLTRASASELSIPVAKKIQGRQSVFINMISTIFTYQIQMAIEKGKIQEGTNLNFAVDLPRVFLRDASSMATALGQLTMSLETAVMSEWITNESASELYQKTVTQLLGIEVEKPLIAS